MTEASARGGFAALDHCVHCGFCLQACPTFLATGDEADSPRGRIELMRGLERGDVALDDATAALHLDRCLGCRGCEPVCPSGVDYGQGLEAARAVLAERRGVSWLVRAVLALLTAPGVSTVGYAIARGLRATGLPTRFAGWGRARFALGMLAATRPGRRRSRVGRPAPQTSLPQTAVTLFRGCVMDGLFRHVHDATERTLAVNGYDVVPVPKQGCCGALHLHAGLRAAARTLALRNVAAFGASDAPIVVNSAGCGAILKEYGHLLPDDREARAFARRVRDVTEVLATRGPVPGAPLDRRVVYDPPCHLMHAQRVAAEPLAVLGAIPVLQLVPTADAAQCCGSAGLYTLVEPEMSRAVLAPKLDSLRDARPEAVATGNPGCLMQIGAGLHAAKLPIRARHPVELLDDSYQAAGFYG